MTRAYTVLLLVCLFGCAVTVRAACSNPYTLSGWDFYGSDLSNAAAADIATCVSLCSSQSGCAAATLSAGVCYMKSAAAMQNRVPCSGCTAMYCSQAQGSLCPNTVTLNTVDLYGADVANVKVASITDCVSACQSTAGCTAATMSAGVCYMKSMNALATQTYCAGCTSFYCSGQDHCPNWVSYAGKDYGSSADNIASVAGTTIADCQTACKANPACVAVTLYSNTCYLKAASATKDLHDCASCSTGKCGGGDSSKWKVVWEDQFNGPAGSGLDRSQWNYDMGWNNGWGNKEWESYTDSTNNVYQDGQGNLVIKAIKNGDTYTSGRVNTAGHAGVVQYGRIEARAKIPAGQGIWPAFWMLGTNGKKWPSCGEIDIMENIGKASEQSKVVGTPHYGNGIDDKLSAWNSGSYDAGVPLTNDYHIFAVEWSPDKIMWFLDDKPSYWTFTKSQVNSPYVWPFNDGGYFIILNLAVGGEWPGYPDATTHFPAYYYIDYVRISQLKPGMASIDNLFATNSSSVETA